MHLKSFISICLIGQVVAQATTEPSSGSASKTLPPSPTGSICQPHGDHWHCHASSTAAVDTHLATGSCEPHGDHWHCPSGVPKPTTPPAQTQTGAKPTATGDDHDDHDDHDHGNGKECTPHNDHWHCPSGVSAPTYPPTAATTKAPSSSGSSSGTAAAATSTTVTAGAGRANVVGAASFIGAVLAAVVMA